MRFAGVLLTVLVLAAPASAADWVQRTLGTQYELGSTLPLRNAPWLGTHNSFNSSSEPPTLSGLDNNQVLSLGAQLDAGMRSLEIDAHWFPSLEAGGAKAPVACHARPASEGHLGCTTERLFADRLREVNAWLAQHPGQVVLLYVEDALESVEGYDAGAAAIKDTIGPRVYAPPATGACTQMPLDVTRDQIREAGKQVLIISGCGPEGSTWPSVVWGDAERAHNESGDPAEFKPYPTCDSKRDAAFYAQHFVRYYEDSTYLTAGVGYLNGTPPSPITPENTAWMVRCGVDLLGFDKLTPTDPRLRAAVWSFSPGQPRVRDGHCTVEKAGGRWRAASCSAHHAFACHNGATGAWSVDKRPARYSRAPRRCPGAPVVDVPRTGFDAQRLRDAMAAAGVHTVFIALRR